MGRGAALEIEQLAESLRLSPAHRNLRLLRLIHTQLITGLEPRNHLPYVLNIHHIRPMHTPELLRIELICKLFQSAAVRVPLDCPRHDTDRALLNGGEADLALIYQQKTVLCPHNHLASVSFW